VSLRQSRATLSHPAPALLSQSTRGPRLFVVVLGGATYTELRHVYEQSRQSGVQVILVSTHFLTARQYLASLDKVTFD
jgi:hypothetical protein